MAHIGMNWAGGKTVGLILGMAAVSGACGNASQDAPGSGAHAGAGGSTAFNPQASGLPCNIADIIGNNCVVCHGNPPAKGVPLSLTTYEAFKKPSPADPAKTVGEMALQRMNDTQYPMPPTGQLSADQIQAFSDWISSGMPTGDCSGAGGAGGAVNVPTSPLACTGQQWPPYSNHESPNMHPGVACINCHQNSVEAPPLTIAGTVYADNCIDDNCYGAQGAEVDVTDANGNVIPIGAGQFGTTNASGNFYYEGPVAFPITAKVVFNGKERAMKQSVTTGDCNSCHTWDGANNAPGRILLP